MKRSFLVTLLAFTFGLLFAACSAQSAPTAAPTAPLPSPSAANTNAGGAACATDNHAPMDAYRPDPVSKLTASTKPKLIEFYAVW
jgi:hypothetical protein